MFEIFRCYKLPYDLFQHVNYNKQPFTFTKSTNVHFSSIISGTDDLQFLISYYLFMLVFLFILFRLFFAFQLFYLPSLIFSVFLPFSPLFYLFLTHVGFISNLPN
jgi:hypothetical protein